MFAGYHIIVKGRKLVWVEISSKRVEIFPH